MNKSAIALAAVGFLGLATLWKISTYEKPHRKHYPSNDLPHVTISLPTTNATLEQKVEKEKAERKKDGAKIRVPDSENPFRKDLPRFATDNKKQETINDYLARHEGHLPPWINGSIAADDVAFLKYYDEASYLRLSTDGIDNLRVDTRYGNTQVKIFEVRKDKEGNPINTSSIENGPYRPSINRATAQTDDFTAMAEKIFSADGYQLEELEKCLAPGWNSDIQCKGYSVHVRSFQKKSPNNSVISSLKQTDRYAPELSVSIVSSDGTTNNAYMSGYFAFGDFTANGKVARPLGSMTVNGNQTITYEKPDIRTSASTNFHKFEWKEGRK